MEMIRNAHFRVHEQSCIEHSHAHLLRCYLWLLSNYSGKVGAEATKPEVSTV